MQASEPKDSNPYVAVVAKKHRNLKKKLERIAKAEQLLAQGKVLDEEQRILLSSKKAIEKSVAELANIKQMLEEVAKSEESNSKTEKDASAPSATEAEVQEEMPESTAQDAATFTESAEQFAAATMTEEEDQDEQFEEPVPEVDLKEKFNQFIERLIKALHVYERYANVTSQPLPDTVMYFGRTLLGLTSISSFQDTLANSIRVAGFYLHDDLATTNDVIRGTSYAKLATEIDALVEEMERAQQRGSTNALTALLRNTIAPVSPTNAPATVETSTYESSGLYGSLQFGDQSLGAFNQFQYTAPSPVYSSAPEPVGFQATPAAAVPAAATETRPVVPIAPTLPEYEHEPVIEEPSEEEEEEEDVVHHHHHHDVPETEEHDAHIEEIVDDEEDMTNAVNPAAAAGAEENEAHQVAEVTVSPEEEAKSRVNKNIRVRGDPSRAARKAEDAKKVASRGISHHHEHLMAASTANAHHHVEAPKTFRDRLLVSSHHHTAAATPAAAPAAPVAAAPAAAATAAPQEASEEAEKRSKRAPRASTAPTAAATSAEAGETASPTSATKRDRNTRTRTRRSEGETAVATEQAAEAGKKWSAIAANPTSETDAAATAGAEEKKTATHRVSAPKPARSSTGGATRPRREKPAVSEDTAHVHAPAEHADGFQPVSRRTPSTAGGAAAPASGAAKKEKDGEKKTSSSAPRGDKPPAKKPTPFK